MAAVKILVAGDVRGQFELLYARVATVHSKHGPFSCLLCVGDFFGPHASAAAAIAPYVAGARGVPVPTYFIAGADAASPMPPAFAALEPGSELATGITFLGANGVRTVEGLRVAFASSADATDEKAAPGLAELRAVADEAGFVGVDVFLSNAWPRGCFRKLDDGTLPAELMPDRDLQDVGTEAVAELASVLRPRYHLCGNEGQAWQRPPFRLPGGQVSRLVALAAVQTDKKQKWLHALSLVPLAGGAGVAAEPEGTTDCPYPYLRAAPSTGGGGGSGGGGGGGGGGRGGGGGSGDGGGGPAAKKRRTEYVKDPRSWIADKCWFCMSSPNFESRLVASICEETYLCLAKGGLVPFHSLVLPIVHKSNSLELTDGERAEMHAYIDALRKSCAERGEAVLLFERFVGNSQFEHMHLQAIPLPNRIAAAAKGAFEKHGASYGIRFEPLPAGAPLSSVMQAPEPFFLVELPSGEQLLHRLATNPRRHPLQFGREVVAGLLGNPQRSDWKMCMPRSVPGGPSLEELEQELTDTFKAAFAPCDPAGGL